MAECVDLVSAKKQVSSFVKKMPKGNSRIHYQESSIAKPGFTEPKAYAFWTLVIILCLLAWGNMILTLVIFRVLHLGQGLESLELLPDSGITKFYGETYLGNLFKPDGKIKCFENSLFEIKGRRGLVAMDVEDLKGNIKSSMKLEQNGTHIRGVKELIVGQSFSTDSPNFKMSGASRNLDTKITTTSHITSAINEKLVLRSDSFTKLSGSEGTAIEGKEIVWTADQQVHLKAINGSIILSGKDGISLDVTKIPVVRSRSVVALAFQYKVCVCMPQGKLFRVPVSKNYSTHSACHNIDVSSEFNPCM